MEYIIRKAKTEDIRDLVRLRRQMYVDMGIADQEKLSKGDGLAADYFAKSIPDGSFQAWLGVLENGSIIAAGGLVIDEHPPGPNNMTGRVGYIMNVVTDPDYRRKGVATAIMTEIIDYLKSIEVTFVALHTTEPARPLYKKFGFFDSNEMKLYLTYEEI